MGTLRRRNFYQFAIQTPFVVFKKFHYFFAYTFLAKIGIYKNSGKVTLLFLALISAYTSKSNYFLFVPNFVVMPCIYNVFQIVYIILTKFTSTLKL